MRHTATLELDEAAFSRDDKSFLPHTRTAVANRRSAGRAVCGTPPVADPESVYRWRTPGTCGELLQGALGGRDYMVNCPIDLYATAQATITKQQGLQLHDAPAYGKVLATLRMLEQRWRNASTDAAGISLKIDSGIPRSKGMASSSADAGSALAAVAACRGIRLGEAEVARLMTAVEPSDCTNFSGIAHLDFTRGDLIERLPAPVGLKVLVLDCGGEVQTLAFDRERARAIYARHADRLSAALTMLKRGLRQSCNQAVGLAASVSTELSQLILPKRALPELRRLCNELAVLGINCAHSGTVLGLLYNAAPGRDESLRESVQRHFGADLPVIGNFNVIGGGNHAV